jgi:ribosome-associated protein
LDQFLKWQGLVGTGGEAKQRIQGGEVRVNGFQETRRGRKLKPGDRVELAGQTVLVPAEAGSQP